MQQNKLTTKEIIRRIKELTEQELTCPKCGTRMTQTLEEHKYTCPKCGYTKYFLGLDWTKLRVPPWILQQMVYEGYLKVSFKSRSGTYYMLVSEPEEEQEQEPNDIQQIKKQVEEDLFDSIIGYDDVKEFFLDLIQNDPPDNVGVLLVGSPASAKSMFLYELSRLPDSYLVVMGTSTKAGIREAILENEPRFLLIDEMDKFTDNKDLSILLTAIDPGYIVVTMRERRVKKKVHMHVIGACNTTFKLPPELLSRFIIFKFKPYNSDEIYTIVKNVCMKRYNRPEDMAEYVAKATTEKLKTKDPRKGISICKMATNLEKAKKIIEMMIKYS